MKRFYISLLSIPVALAVAAQNPLPQTGSGETDGFKLVWQELFDSGSLNPERWEIEVNGNGGGNNELQYYREENVSVGDDGRGNGCLIITARRENFNGKNFTSGRVISKNRTMFTHGKVEASIRFPKTANGLWPAFWMMGNDFDEVGWPRCGETDIIEMGHQNGIRNNIQDRYFNGAMHWGQRWDQLASHAPSTANGYSLQDDEFHLLTVIWDTDALAMYLDLDKDPGKSPYFYMTIPADEPDNAWSPGNYFHKDNFILFNLAIGGNFPGIYNADGITALNDENGQEAKMYVNYLRIYQKGTADEHLSYVSEPDEDNSGIAAVSADARFITRDRDGLRLSRDCRLTVVTTDGTVVFDAPARQGSFPIDSFASGIYIARGSDADGTVATLKFSR